MHSLSQRLIREIFQTPNDGMIGGSGEFGRLFVTMPESDERSLLEVESKVALGARIVLLHQSVINPHHLERSLFQVMGLLRIQRQDLPRNLPVGSDECK
jgi:hypothetical protein